MTVLAFPQRLDIELEALAAEARGSATREHAIAVVAEARRIVRNLLSTENQHDETTRR